MADFWKGFGQGFGPAFESSYDRARSRREKKEDRKYAEKQRQAEIDRLAQIAKDKSVAGTLAYGDAGVDLRGAQNILRISTPKQECRGDLLAMRLGLWVALS